MAYNTTKQQVKATITKTKGGGEIVRIITTTREQREQIELHGMDGKMNRIKRMNRNIKERIARHQEKHGANSFVMEM
eukprot:m.30301 g.30301  ORF g.30301 m.30301 type:complete len:77 (-) comp9630_c0_seq1:329-559(-)